jgi:ABC-type bacteriocin/lantibiotic exporter with double-glycine peptidase domain
MIALPPVSHTTAISIPATVAVVPFYSQFKDIDSVSWQKVSCGIASLAMVIDFYKPASATPNTLLKQGIAAGAYDTNAGWKHSGLVALAKTYGLDGTNYDLTSSDSKSAFTTLKSYLKKGPVIVSVHYKFDPKSPIPHMVVIDGISSDTLYYNDPASKTGQQQISVEKFLAAWKQQFIVIAPTSSTKVAATILTAPKASLAAFQF